MRRLVLISLAWILLVPSVLACSAEIISINYNPQKVEAGSPVEVVATVRYHVGALDRRWDKKYGLIPSCKFLVEAGIVPQENLLALAPLSVYEQPTQCCPGNDNFAASYVVVECEAWEQLGCTKVETIALNPKAPDEGYCDHCGGMYGNQNPSCHQDPNFYWAGEGWYVLGVGVYKGCYYDLISKGEEQEIYDRRTALIYVHDGADGENRDWWNEQIDELPLTYGDLVLIVVVILLFVLSAKYIVRGGKK